MLLQAFYPVRSEQLLLQRLEYDLPFRWFVGIGVDDAVFDDSVFQETRPAAGRAIAGKLLA
ncbi:Transposase domain [Bradyrhizobium shewense]|uniref:Transposase domain n=1 Tax=Bradyrhizobium shewense TaxID=1761772 RepID=A0A1C3XUL3_9BRAD|nr:Transposase domain [Bradyrhizobium shewense]